MNKGHKSLPLFSSLDAYYPGVLTMVGDIEQARKTLLNYYLIWRQYGSLPEFYNIQSGSVHSNRETYPLRPEFIESIMYIYRATNDEKILAIAFEFLEAIETVTRLECGYATVSLFFLEKSMLSLLLLFFFVLKRLKMYVIISLKIVWNHFF
jgi:mannosidase alpha-like ER degradation enhancer 2